MLDSIYHMTLKLIKNLIFEVNTSRFCHLFHKVTKSVNHYSGLSILLHGVISLPRRHVINIIKSHLFLKRKKSNQTKQLQTVVSEYIA